MESEREPQAGEPGKWSRSDMEGEGERIMGSDESERADVAVDDGAGETRQEAGERRAELFAGGEREEAERRWADIQARFVDEPRSSVEEANALVADLMDRLVSGFGAERSRLENSGIAART
jgi:hypothetical protein